MSSASLTDGTERNSAGFGVLEVIESDTERNLTLLGPFAAQLSCFALPLYASRSKAGRVSQQW